MSFFILFYFILLLCYVKYLMVKAINLKKKKSNGLVQLINWEENYDN